LKKAAHSRVRGGNTRKPSIKRKRAGARALEGGKQIDEREKKVNLKA